MTRKQQARSIQGAAIPVATTGTMMDIPNTKAINLLRTDVINAIWGRGRKIQAAEVALAILNGPTKTDPLAAILFKRLSDARRLMAKDPRRQNLA